MSVIDYLVETPDSKEINSLPEGNPDYLYRMLEHLVIGDYALSIQASSTHHCLPKDTLDNLADYTHLEMALMDHATGQSFLTVSEVLPTFSQLLVLEEHRGGPVYSYVPVKLLDLLFLEMMEEFG